MALTTAGERQELALQVLELLNRSDDRIDTIRDILGLLKEKSGFEAVGLRLEEGDDFPYYEVSGFDRTFVEAENSVCAHNGNGEVLRDAAGRPVLECLCGLVLQERTRCEGPHSTAGGTFWTNRSSVLTQEADAVELPERPRYRCVHDGYESLALVPLRAEGRTVGLLQFNDPTPDRFDPELLHFLEGLANSIGVSLQRKHSEEQLQEMYQLLKRRHDDHLSTLNMLRLGIIALDGEGRVAFVNRAAQHFIGVEPEAILRRLWTELEFFPGALLDRIGNLLSQPENQRERTQAEIDFGQGSRYWMDIEVRDDPADPGRRILFLYDMTQIYDLRQMLDASGRYHDLIGRSVIMRDLFRRIQEVAGVDFTVLVEGPTGAGKELVARAIHKASPRARRPFVAVNCAGLSESLLTSQLFGHKRGAFTGAVEDHVGYFEAAHQGTLFLDEIGDISAGLQATLLRVLEEKRVTRVGETRSRPVDVRIVAATNHDLAEDARLGRFRTDLLYRLRVARLTVPPLRDRREDVPALASYFLRQAGALMGKEVPGLASDAMRSLVEHDWPGNVRELKAAIEFACIHCQGRVSAADLPPEIRPAGVFTPVSVSAHGPEPTDERTRILRALERTEGNRTRAARELGMSRATFYRRLTDLNIS